MIRIALDRSAVSTTSVRTGIGRYVQELANALRSMVGGALVESDAFDLWSGLTGSSVSEIVRGIAREHVWLPTRLRQAGIDVYHAPASRAPSRRVGIPLVVTVHDFAAYEYPDLQGLRRGAKLRRQVERAVLDASLVIVPSESVRREMGMRFPEHVGKARVAQHGVSAIFQRPRRAPANPTFLSVATLEKRKNLATLIDAFALVAARHADARLRLIGQPDNDTVAIRERLIRRGLVEVVSVEGYLSDEAVATAYASATATVYPSLYEGFGLPLIESMAAGAPVIAANINVAREVAGDAAVLVEPRDAEAMAAAMLRTIEDCEWNRALSDAGRTRAALFTWERSALEHIEVYHVAHEGSRR